MWDFIVTICKNPEIVQNAIDAKIALLQEQLGDIEHDAELLDKAITNLSDERQWVITAARKGKITEDDMDTQLSTVDLQILGLRKKLDEKLSVIVVQQQTDHLKEWTDQYLANMANGLRILNVDLAELSDVDRTRLYSGLGAQRFEEKYNGDKTAALRWAILEEKRRTVRMLVDKILLVKDPDGSKRIIPLLSFELPNEFVSMVYNDQSLAYVEKAKELIGDD